MIGYLQQKQKYSYNKDEVTYFIVPLYDSCYLDCEYYAGHDYIKDAQNISINIISWKQKAFLDELYKGKDKKIANSYISGDFNFEKDKSLVSMSAIIVYEDIIKRIDSYKVELVEQGYIRFLKKDLISNLNSMNSPLGVFDTLFRSSYKDIWSVFIENFVFLSLEVGWSKEKILEELYSPYMSHNINFWKNSIKKPIDMQFIKICEDAYNKVKNLKFQLPTKSLYDYECSFDELIKGVLKGKIIPI